jgi:hypothetical protein
MLWSALAPLLAGQPRVRLSPDRGKSYPQRYERNLTSVRPSNPAAVRIYGKDGTCAAIFLDFDSSIAGPDWVEADVRSVQTWLHRFGARWIEDYSPNGGRHIYVPLARRVPFNEARNFVEALGNRLRTLDKTPHQNLHHGCMRTPGSAHKERGEHQRLAMSLSMAYDVVRRPNSGDIWDALTEDLSSEIAAVRTLRLEDANAVMPATTAPLPQASLPATGRRMSRAAQDIARTGDYDTSRYASDSEARQAVIASAVAAGMQLSDVQARMHQGLWPGLSSFYARYRSRHRSDALKRDWKNARRFIEQNSAINAAQNNVRRSPTSQPPTQPGVLQGRNSDRKNSTAEHRYIRTWRNTLALREHRYTGSRNGMARRMVLRAVGQAAHMNGSRFIEFGDRSLAVATGLDHTTVGVHLRALRSETDPLITLVEAGRGTHGDLYMLTIPDELEDSSNNRSWTPGKLHALRPVFRELGMPAAFVYEALETATTPLSTTQLVKNTGLSRTGANEALQILAAWKLIERRPDLTWVCNDAADLRALAEYFGVMEAVGRQLQRYRIEREQWHQWLASNVTPVGVLPSPTDDYAWWDYEGPPDDYTLVDLALAG